MTQSNRFTSLRSIGRYIFVGVLTVAPLAITWIILDFLFTQLARIGGPWVRAIANAISPDHPVPASWLQNETFQSILAVLGVLGILWGLGWATTRLIGQKLISLFEGMIGMIPIVDKIYQATKRFLTVAGNSPEGERRVVLIDFPSPEMKAIGLVTRILKDEGSGEELAAVYVPTSPNPTSGYIEIVPVTKLTFTDWSFDEALSFVVSGGSNAPDTVTYFPPEKAKVNRDAGTAARSTPKRPLSSE